MPFVFDPLPHAEARDRIAALPLLQREVFDELLPELKAYAFTITGLDSFDQLARARDLIKAVPAGEKTWDQAKHEIADEIGEALGGKEAQTRAELLLRTHTFRGYAASRYRLLMQQRDVFPYWQYKTHGDARVRPSHAALNGKVFPAGHPIWQRIFPPSDWGCRCLIVPLLGSDPALQRYRDADEKKAPEDKTVYDGDLADAIHRAERLPNGISLLPSKTWGASPWSEPGTVQHTWALIQERYADQPEVLKAFGKWARKTRIPETNKTVWTWVNGPRKRIAKAKAPEWPGSIDALKTIRHLGGSTGATLVKDSAGKQFVLKRGSSEEHLRSEFAADQIYRELGVAVPEARIYESPSGPAKLARYVEGRRLSEYLTTATDGERVEVLKKVRENFLADAWLGNWDVAGMDLDNILVDAAGVPWRIDNGGALGFRARGKKKSAAEWGSAVPEIESLLDESKNPSAARVFSGITQDEIRDQLANLVAKSEAALAVAPEGVRDVLRARLATLQDRFAPKSFSAAFAGEVRAARLVGKTHLGDKDLVEDTTVLFWQEADENGAPLTRMKLRLTQKGSDALVEALRDELSALKPLAATIAKRTLPGDSFWSQIEPTIKHINYHASDGIYNPAKTAVLDKVAQQLTAFPSTTEDQKSMVAHYQAMIAELKSAMATKGKTAFFAQYEPPEPRSASSSRRRTNLDIKATQLKWVEKSKDRGFARRQKNEILNQQSYQIEGGGATLNVIPWTEANGARSSAPYAFRGYVEMTIPGEVTPETLEKAAKLMNDAGVDISPAPREFSELLYLRKNLMLREMTAAKKASWRAIDDDPSLDDAAKAAALKSWVEKNLKIKLTADNYQPLGKANSFGQGWQRWERFDLPRAQIEAEMGDYTLTHHSATPLPELVDSILNGGGQFTPTTERLRAGVPITSGMSPHQDMATGGANYLFTRIRQKTAGRHGSALHFKIGNLARMDQFSFSGDRYGDVRPVGENSYGDPHKGRATSIAKWKANAARSSNETIFKWGLSLLDEIETIQTSSASERQAVIAVFRKHKYARLPDGRDIEDIVK